METNKTNEKKINSVAVIVAAIGLVALIVIMTVLFLVFREKPVEGSKSISIEVISKEEISTKYELQTDAEYLRQAMEEAEGLEFTGSESEYGMMVETVNGELADYNVDGAYWAFFVNGDYCNYGIDTQPVEDGDAFSIVYTVYAP